MGIRHVGVPGGRIDLAARPRDDLPIPEVIDQRRVVGVEQARPAHQGEGEHMLVVLTCRLRCCGVPWHDRPLLRRSLSERVHSRRRSEPLDESSVPGSTPLEVCRPQPTVRVGSTANRRIACRPAGGRFRILRMPRWHQRWRTLQSDRPSRLVHEELAVAVRCIQARCLAHRISRNGMNVESPFSRRTG